MKHEHSQAEMFAGIGGSDVQNMPSSHSQKMPEKCITCHKYEEKKDTALPKGGHNFTIDDRVCLKCHENREIRMAEWKAKIPPMLERLKTLIDNFPDKKSKAYRTAATNYRMVIADGGIGTHNPRYAQALLQQGISLLSVESVWK